MNNANAIIFQHVSKSYGNTPVLRDLSLTVRQGECLTVIGPSGCGKTTMLKLINGLLTPDCGEIIVDGRPILGANLIELRRNIGYVIQSTGLFTHMTIAQNIAYVPSLSKLWPKADIKKRCNEWLEKVGLDASFANRYPRELSGGQCQRVGIARALAANPKILLMDEPFGAVDGITRVHLQKMLIALRSELAQTIVVVTHDISEALHLGDRVLVMQEGQITRLDTPKAIIEQPQNAFVEGLLASR